MEAKKLRLIVDELSKYAGMVSDEEVKAFANLIAASNKIFLAGAGRSGLAAKGFTNRLLHMGFDVHFVGEISCPPIREGDLLVVNSGSGTTQSLIVMAKKAKEAGAKIATLTMYPSHQIGEMSDISVTVPGRTEKKLEGEKNLAESIQPMGNLFEQLCWLTYDSTIMELMDILNQTSDEMFARHTNLE